jgi:hypothetical protein
MRDDVNKNLLNQSLTIKLNSLYMQADHELNAILALNYSNAGVCPLVQL